MATSARCWERRIISPFSFTTPSCPIPRALLTRDKGTWQRVRGLLENTSQLEEEQKQLADETALRNELQLIIGRLEDFAAKVRKNLDQVNWLDRRAILRALVKRVEIGRTHVTVVFRIGPTAAFLIGAIILA